MKKNSFSNPTSTTRNDFHRAEIAIRDGVTIRRSAHNGLIDYADAAQQVGGWRDAGGAKGYSIAFIPSREAADVLANALDAFEKYTVQRVVTEGEHSFVVLAAGPEMSRQWASEHPESNE